MEAKRARRAIGFVGDALRVEVPHDPAQTPRFHLGSAPGGWVRVALDGASLAYARHEAAWQSVVWTRVVDRSSAIVPPIASDLARSITRAGWVGWLARTLFVEASRPLVAAGTYALAPLSPRRELERPAFAPPTHARGADALHRAPRTQRVRWSSQSTDECNVFALRDASRDDASRVKAWRKHASDGTLPPALLAWVSALDGYVVLDGHDRLHAAALEGIDAPLVSLHPVREHALSAEVLVEATRRYELAFAHEAKLSAETRTELNRHLVGASSPWMQSTSTARFEPDLSQRFRAETQGLVLDDDVLRIFSR